MTVSELIEKLQTMPQDAIVVYPWGYDYGGLADVITVKKEKIGVSDRHMDHVDAFRGCKPNVVTAVILSEAWWNP